MSGCIRVPRLGRLVVWFGCVALGAFSCVSSSESRRVAPPVPNTGAGTAGTADDEADSGAAGGAGGSAGVTSQASGPSGDAGQSGNSEIDGGDAGTGGTSGTSGNSSSTGGTSGASGTSGTGGGALTCGNSVCTANQTCLGGVTCSCISRLKGNYVFTANGRLRQELRVNGLPTLTESLVYLDGSTLLSGAVDVSEAAVNGAGGHGCALLEDGTVWCWRTSALGNLEGQLGQGATDADGPLWHATQVLSGPGQPLSDVVTLSTVAAGAYVNRTCAVTKSGKLYCWGDLRWIVNGSAYTSSAYAQAITSDGVTPLSNVVDAALGGLDACVVRSGGTKNEVWCWGYNEGNTLGLGDALDHQYPTKVAGFDAPTKVVLNGSFYNFADSVCALDGANVRCVGYNGTGQVGIGTLDTPVLTPVTVRKAGGATLNNVSQLVPGNSNYCALLIDHTLWCWGPGAGSSATNIPVADLASVAGDTGDLWTYEPRYLTTANVVVTGASQTPLDCN